MKPDFLSGLLLDLWSDLQQPAVFWQVATIAGCLLAGWLLARLARAAVSRKHADDSFLHIGIDSFSRVLSPSIGLLLILAARPLLGRFHHVNLLRVTIPLVGAFVLIRLSFYVLRRIFARGGRVGITLMVFEKLIAILIWIGFALYITGLWPDLINLLDSTELPFGHHKVSLLTMLQAVVSVAITLVVALWAGALVEQSLMQLDSVHSSIRAVMARMARALLIVVAILVSLSLVGIDLTVLSVFGGALGVGLGLGLQKIVGSYVSGFVILLERSMAIGDMVTVDKYYGQVTRINTRYTILRGLDGIESVIPNDLFISGPVQNYSLTDRALRLATHVAVAYDTDVEAVLPLLEEAAASVARVSKTTLPSASLQKFGTDGLELEVGFWIADPENGRANVVSDVNRAIWQLLKSNGIKVPYNQREVRILNENFPMAAGFDAGPGSPDVATPSIGAAT
jgi:small-conductance mechanosensitive channel